jgi:hypothetical protein
MKGLELKGADIGGPRFKGRTELEGGRYRIEAGGADIWDEQDHCHFAYAPHTGDFSLIARVESLGLSHPYAKSGLMVRESLRPESAMVYFFVFPDNRSRNHNNGGYEFHVREGSAATCKAGYPKGDDGEGEPPYPVRFPNAWLKLSREGRIFRTAAGRDGVSWKDYNELALDLPETMLIGIAVTAHDDAASTKSCVSGLSLAGPARL